MVPLNASHLMVILKSRGEDRKGDRGGSGGQEEDQDGSVKSQRTRGENISRGKRY